MADKDDDNDLRRSGKLDEKNATGQAYAYRQQPPPELFQEPDLPDLPDIAENPQRYGI